jgi:hypothetical protein
MASEAFSGLDWDLIWPFALIIAGFLGLSDIARLGTSAEFIVEQKAVGLKGVLYFEARSLIFLQKLYRAATEPDSLAMM